MDADALAAHDLLSELRTRITTQPLPYQYGAESRALESLWEVFGQARAAMQRYPGCARFSALATQMLNMDLRPITAKWDHAYEEGRLSSRDGAESLFLPTLMRPIDPRDKSPHDVPSWFRRLAEKLLVPEQS